MQNSNFTSELYGTNFYDTELGFAVGGNNGTILRTANGGGTWTSVSSGTTTFMNDVDFPTRNTGFAVGLNGVILKSTNSGISWFALNSSTSASLICVSFLDSLNGVAGGNRIVLKTTNGGITWVSQAINFINFNPQVTGINYIDSGTIISLTNVDDRINKTTNGGLNWLGYNINLPEPSDIPRNISFINENTGYMVTSYGLILKSINGGINWSIDSTFKPRYPQILVLQDVDVINTDYAFVSGAGGRIIKTTNSGNSWITTTGGRSNLESNFFVNENTGYTVGYDGVILKTTNAGTNWLQQTVIQFKT
ncbi:MAG: YCF48-related protein [Ignavibacteria bacterium]